MVSQFVSPHKVNLLGELDYTFPEGTHAVGRLDNDSEGLLILTTNKKVTSLLFESEEKHSRTYLVMVKNVVNEETLHRLRTGITFKIEGGEEYQTTPCDIDIVPDPRTLYKHVSDYREAYPHTWLKITLTEGKYHQVRKMVQTVNHRCQRLIRISIEDLQLDHLASGEVKELPEEMFFQLLHLTA